MRLSVSLKQALCVRGAEKALRGKKSPGLIPGAGARKGNVGQVRVDDEAVAVRV